jgi:hypothetical protein
MSSKFLIIGTFHLRPVALGQGPWRVWVDFVRGLLRAGYNTYGAAAAEAIIKEILRIDVAEVPLISLLFSPCGSAGFKPPEDYVY